MLENSTKNLQIREDENGNTGIEFQEIQCTRNSTVVSLKLFTCSTFFKTKENHLLQFMTVVIALITRLCIIINIEKKPHSVPMEKILNQWYITSLFPCTLQRREILNGAFKLNLKLRDLSNKTELFYY